MWYEYIVYAAVLILAVIGLCQLIGWAKQRIIFGKQAFSCVTIIPIKGNQENIELVVRAAIGDLRWNQKQRADQILLLDYGMDEETNMICQLLCKDMNQVQVLKPEELHRPFNDIIGNRIS